MRRNTLKLFACASLLAFGIGAANHANAQTADIPVTLTITNAITVTAGTDLDFGEWLLVHSGTSPAGDITLAINPDSGLITPTAGTGSTAVNITPSAGVGTVTINTPAAASVDMYGTLTDFTATTLSLGTLQYSLNSGTPASLSVTSGSPTTISSTGGTDDTIAVGGTLTVNGVTADGPYTANIEMAFSY